MAWLEVVAFKVVCVQVPGCGAQGFKVQGLLACNSMQYVLDLGCRF